MAVRPASGTSTTFYPWLSARLVSAATTHGKDEVVRAKTDLNAVLKRQKFCLAHSLRYILIRCSDAFTISNRLAT